MSSNNDFFSDNSTLSYVLSCVENEGFAYCFESYSDFKTVKDTIFHKKLNDYLKAKNDLEIYIKKQSNLELKSIKNK